MEMIYSEDEVEEEEPKDLGRTKAQLRKMMTDEDNLGKRRQ